MESGRGREGDVSTCTKALAHSAWGSASPLLPSHLLSDVSWSQCQAPRVEVESSVPLAQSTFASFGAGLSV